MNGSFTCFCKRNWKLLDYYKKHELNLGSKIEPKFEFEIVLHHQITMGTNSSLTIFAQKNRKKLEFKFESKIWPKFELMFPMHNCVILDAETSLLMLVRKKKFKNKK
jgi:hypothetical protein